MANNPTASYSFELVISAADKEQTAQVLALLSGNDCEIVSMNRCEEESVFIVNCGTLSREKELVSEISNISGIKIKSVIDRTFSLHDGGKLDVVGKNKLNSKDDLAMAYTPGVARICMAIHDDVARSYSLTVRKNCVAVLSDGTAVLGLGDIGPEAAMPVMEGKCQLFKEFGGVDAFPICVNTKDVEEIIAVAKAITPTFGGINLEDISAPRCFEIEDRLKAELEIPVFHDDQHGTAVVTLAALINALKIVNKKISDLKVIVSGVGAAGIACSKILMNAGVTNIIGCDRSGAIYEGRTENMNSMKEWYAKNTNPQKLQGKLSDVIAGADLFLGVSGPGTLSLEDLKLMAKDAIVFAMANPVPEIMPEIANPHVAVMATGRSDYPNQINNVLAFPGIFAGALSCRASQITENMKIAAAYAIAEVVSDDELNRDYIIPSPFNPCVGERVTEAVRQAAIKDGVARNLGENEVLPFEKMDR